MKTEYKLKNDFKVVITTCETTGIRVKTGLNVITDMKFYYVIPKSGKEYAVTKELAEDLIESFV